MREGTQWVSTAYATVHLKDMLTHMAKREKKAMSFYDSFHAEGLRLQSNINHGGVIEWEQTSRPDFQQIIKGYLQNRINEMNTKWCYYYKTTIKRHKYVRDDLQTHNYKKCKNTQSKW